MPWTDFDSGNGIGVLGLSLLWGVINLKKDKYTILKIVAKKQSLVTIS